VRRFRWRPLADDACQLFFWQLAKTFSVGLLKQVLDHDRYSPWRSLCQYPPPESLRFSILLTWELLNSQLAKYVANLCRPSTKFIAEILKALYQPSLVKVRCIQSCFSIISLSFVSCVNFLNYLVLQHTPICTTFWETTQKLEISCCVLPSFWAE